MIQKSINLLGHYGKDKVTGFEGIIESVSFDLYGCIQLWIIPNTLKEDGSKKDGAYFDIHRITIQSEKQIMISNFHNEKTPATYPHGPAVKAPRS